jgi:hypothetical protein
MKLKALGALCKQRCVFCLYDDIAPDGEIMGQWLGTDGALYSLTGLPYLTAENLIRMFDITKKQEENLVFRSGPLRESSYFENTVPGEILIERNALSIVRGGYTLMPLFTESDIEFIDTELFAPVRDILDEVEIYERRAAHTVYFAVKLGFMVTAVLLPVRAIDEAFVEQAEELARRCRAALKRKARNVEEPEQTEI